jgi:hypothetical protein
MMVIPLVGVHKKPILLSADVTGLEGWIKLRVGKKKSWE